MRSRGVVGTAAFAAALGAASSSGCSPPDSFIVLSLRSMTVDGIANVANIQVDVSNVRGKMQTLVYRAYGTTIDQTTEKNLSVGFSSGETGSVSFDVMARNDLGCIIGKSTGPTAVDIRKGNVAFGKVTLMALSTPDCSSPDGGAPDGPVGTPLPGCDPVNPQNPQAVDGGATTCTSGQTCQVDCTPKDGGPAQNECITGGNGAPGTACTSNADCTPGTQCFDYTGTGCGVHLCLRFCGGDQDCTAVGAGGSGPGSFCQGPVMCPGFLTAYHTCTFNCDPRAAAAATRGGCPSGLGCIMPGDMDQVDCACLETTRTKGEGATCASAADCSPGLICNRMSGSLTCRPICRCDANAAGACTATTNDCPTTGTTCHAVTNNKIYGICLP
jgi:hypothetical protein